MRYPAINDLLQKVDNKYSLILVTAKRARHLVEGLTPEVKINNENPVSIATEEVARDLIEYKY
ncbi:DNA-directed RNA polymerase subunit omega [Alkalibaculum bacchi]|uniref:DNA-directed RNA polymerase subunit omega n=1 Tax=Alkalibaculum bacchi TaxID=645887 RepID=UPI0026EA23B9|nr:DNA-directed RNA polymerase subunit omega [Alkalibaculum bacchi]